MAVIEAELTDGRADERAVRDEVRSWLGDNLPAGWMEAVAAGDRDKVRELRDSIDYEDWCRRLAYAGWATPSYDPEFNGKGFGQRLARVVNEELGRAGVPRSFNVIGLGMCAPVLMEWGTPEQKKLVPRIASHEDIWCQLFSEPGHGSDVAGLSTRAVRDGDEWILNGQKVWTTLAHLSRWGLIVARTDTEAQKHRGITAFIVDMHAPGVEVRPLRQMTGDAEFNEVYFTDVHVPDTMRIGDPGMGWMVATATLMNERLALGGGGGAGLDTGGGGAAEALIGLAREVGKADDPVVRQEIVQLWIEGKVLRWNNARSQANVKAGQMPGPEFSIGKLFQAEWNKRLQNAAVGIMGAYGLARFGGSDRDAGQLNIPMREGAVLGTGDRHVGSAGMESNDAIYSFLRSRANSIEGGTSEIMRNILGERVLGLPKDVSVDRDIPWSEIRRSS